MLMQASLLRGLFSAGQNVTIDPNGTISTISLGTVTDTGDIGSLIGSLQVVSGLVAQDLVAVSHAGSDYAIAYSNFLDGITIDQAPAAVAASNSDTIWVAQGSNVMASQSLGAIWVWMANNLPTYKTPVIEITANTNLDTTVHNRRILICSQPVTLTPLTNNMGSGFQCVVINASSGNVTLGTGFVTSTGNFSVAAWQSTEIYCVAYSGGTIAFASMPSAATSSQTAVPGQVLALAASGTTSTMIGVSWQSPTAGGVVVSYTVQFRVTGTSSWTNSAPILNATTYNLTALQPMTSYDIAVVAQNATGTGAASTILTIVTAAAVQPTAPSQVVGLAATATSSSAIRLSWTGQTGIGAATSFTVQYRVTGTSGWTNSVPGITGTTDTLSGLTSAKSYDFSVIGVNSAGSATVSATVTASTLAVSASVSTIVWNVLPTGSYTAGSGSIGINAQVAPATSPVQFGFSQSSTVPPASWTAATFVNTNLWGAYLPPPATAGTWFTWGEGLDGSAQTVSSSSFQVA